MKAPQHLHAARADAVTNATDLAVEEVGYDDPVVVDLVAQVQAEYVARYGGPDSTPLTAADFTPPSGAFLVARAGGVPVGCVGLRRHTDGVAELKRLFVPADHRRRGYARRLLAAAERRARELGYARVVLESGAAQPEALAMYVAEGYAPTAPFGTYACSPTSRHFGKDLAVP